MRAALWPPLLVLCVGAPCRGREGLLCASLSVGGGWLPPGGVRSLFHVPAEDEPSTVAGPLLALVGLALGVLMAAVTAASVRLSARAARRPRSRRKIREKFRAPVVGAE
jgi:hypothetical protein